MKRAILAIFLCVTAIESLKADIITLPLPELIGPVGRHPNWDIVSFDLGVTFSAIESVKIQFSGSISPGVGCGDGVEQPVFPYFDVPGIIEVFMDHPATGSCITVIGPYDGSFSIEQLLECTYSANWNILLDGQEELISHITSNLIVIGGVILEYPTATLTEAILIVEGTVFIEPCDYIVGGDQNDDCKVGLRDFAELVFDWQISYDMTDLAEMAANWLIDCNVTPGDPVCVSKQIRFVMKEGRDGLFFQPGEHLLKNYR